MQYSSAKQGRVFVIRLEHGDIIHEEIENIARRENVNAGALIVLGGVDKGSRLIVGPRSGRAKPVTGMERLLNNVHEVAGTGTIFPDANGNPVLHMHLACGRDRKTLTGCVRKGVKTWQVLEVVLFELKRSQASRVLDKNTGLVLLNSGAGATRGRLTGSGGQARAS